MSSNVNRVNSKNFDQVLDEIVVEAPQVQDTDQVTQSKYDSSSILHKADVISLNRGWNDNNEKIIISYGEKIASYQWMHGEQAKRYSLYNRVMGVILIIFSTGLSAETIVPTQEYSEIVLIVRAVFTYIVTLMSVLVNFLKFEQKAEQHTLYASKCGKLYHDIQQQLCMFRRDRHPAHKYVADILKTSDTLALNGPRISQLVINAYKSAHKNSDIKMPDATDKIEVITEQPEIGIKSIHNRSKAGFNNLAGIHHAFQIQGDITDEDIQNANAIELQEYRKRFLQGKSDFEYQRFLQHTRALD
jgi:hypothetical protein